MCITVACELNFGSCIVKRGVIVWQALSSIEIKLSHSVILKVCVSVCVSVLAIWNVWCWFFCWFFFARWYAVTQMNAPWSSVSWAWATGYFPFLFLTIIIRNSRETWLFLFFFDVGWVSSTGRGRGRYLMKPKTHLGSWLTSLNGRRGKYTRPSGHLSVFLPWFVQEYCWVWWSSCTFSPFDKRRNILS